jgi:subtilisin family serine protease
VHTKTSVLSPAVPLLKPASSYELIVKYKQGTPQDLIQRLAKTFGSRIINNYANLPGFSYQAVPSQGLTIQEVIAQYQADPNVEYAEPNFHYQADDISPNDPFFQELWGLKNIGQAINGKPAGVVGADINVAKAWELTTGDENIVVGIVDTGIDYTHSDLAANMWVNPNEIPDNNIDDDGNGVVDDVHGYNAINDSGDPMDDNDHGTHCAGTIGAVGSNGEGIVGVNWNVKLMGLKFLSGSGGGTLNDALEALNYALDMKERGVNLRVLSNSWGGGDYSRALHDAIKALNQAGILFVAAAGNASTDTDRYPHYPSSYDVENVISVAAIDNQDQLARFSNYGATTVDVAAPGVDIYSTVTGNDYLYFSGTSMATPHVSGVAALVLAQHADLSAKQLAQILIDTAQPVPTLKDKVLAGGRVNAYEAVMAK